MGTNTPTHRVIPRTPKQVTLTELGGAVRREAVRIWSNVAVSEARVNLMQSLVREGRGLAELEVFNLNLEGRFKSKKFQEKVTSRQDLKGKMIGPIMKAKLADEQCNLRELTKVRTKARRVLADQLGKNSRQYKKCIADLRQEARKTKTSLVSKYKKKSEHLRKKFDNKKSDQDNQEQEVPEDLLEYKNAVIFDKNRYVELEPDSYEIKVIGEVELTEDELSVLKLHPKFCIVDKLTRTCFEHEQETALAKMRMEIAREQEQEDMTPEEIQEDLEIVARSRQVFDPHKKTYDARRRRVTDLQECSRVTLPKPLSEEEEAKIELRRKSQMEIFQEYIKNNADKNGEQTTNLTEAENKGLRSLQKRIAKRELIVLKIDKSSKLAVTTEDEYMKMGLEHTKNDKEITRAEIIENEELLNGHNRAWAQIWNSGQDHNHSSRIITSKTTHSENIADLYLMFKDHKSGNKTRPTATGHSSNTLGLSNSVSEVLEAVACAEVNRYNTISSEDMLARMVEYNRQVVLIRQEWQEHRLRKIRCSKCKVMEYIDCPNTENHGWEIILQDQWPPRGSPSPGTQSSTVSTTQSPCPSPDEIEQEVDRIWNNNCCGEQVQEQMRTSCTECGKGITKWEAEFCIVGNDVKALYPSIKSKKTGQIIRKRIEKTSLKFDGFCAKKGLAYIAMNQELTDINEIEHLIPKRKSGRTTKLKTTAIGNSWNPEDKFEYTNQEYTEEECKKIAARVTEIATRILFETKMYRFGNKCYKQQEGGSIGDRWTGAAAELVMQDWSEEYKKILENSRLRTPLLAGYVDDGRQGSTTLPLGMRFSSSENKFMYCKDAEQEDKILRTKGETNNQRMARVCITAMNSINSDLEFTVETQEEFENERLPTLDFTIWLEKDGTINHMYYQKNMKTPLVIMNRSATSTQQKIQILSNEMTRRLFNINRDGVEIQEYIQVIDQLTQELRNSEYEYKTALEIVASGIRGWRTRLKRREQKGQPIYRPAHTTTGTRNRKKLLGRETWYKKNENTDKVSVQEGNVGTKLEKSEKFPKTKKTKITRPSTEEKQEHPVKSVMFVPYTPGSQLAKKLRTNEEVLAKIPKSKLKIVERAGLKLQDVLTTSNPWKGQDCGRLNCLLCHTKMSTEKNMRQDCHKRNLVYETRCLTCERKELKRIEELDIENKEKDVLKAKIKQYKYIGETSRSSYERSWEHLNDMAQLRNTSHMLKHAIGVHPDEDMSEVQFGMRVLKFTQSSFERQILESVIIQSERTDHVLLNSRTEYNRCSLPRLCTQIGEQEFKKYGDELELEKLDELKIENKIRQLRKEQNKARLHPTREQGPSTKRRRTGDKNEYISIHDIWGEPEVTKQTKNKRTELE